MTEAPRPARSRWLVFGGAWVLLSLLSALWSFATPIGASPDEPAHMVKAASVVRAQWVGTPTEYGHAVEVPRYVRDTHARTCYAFQPDVTPACAPDLPGDPGELVTGTTTAGLYNPVYYLMVGWPTLIFDDDSGIYAMRLASGIICSALLALSFMLVSQWRRRTLPLIALAFAVTPMVLFLNASVNPNALENVAALTVFVGMLSIVMQPRASLFFERALIVGLAAVLGVNARGLSPFWIAMALAIPLLLASRTQLLALLKNKLVWLVAAAVVLSTGFAGFWLVGANSLALGAPVAGGFSPPPGTGEPPLVGFLGTLELTFSHAQNMVGIFGWLDTPSPPAVYFVWALGVGALGLAALVALRGRSLAVAAALIATVLLLPPLFQAVYISSGGFIWQGRYTLPAFVCMVVGIAALLSRDLPEPGRFASRRLVVIILALWTAAQILAFATALRRYAVGLTGSWPDLLRAPEWSPPGGVPLILGLFAIVLAATAIGAGRLAWPSSKARPLVDAISSLESRQPQQVHQQPAGRRHE